MRIGRLVMARDLVEVSAAVVEVADVLALAREELELLSIQFGNVIVCIRPSQSYVYFMLNVIDGGTAGRRRHAVQRRARLAHVAQAVVEARLAAAVDT